MKRTAILNLHSHWPNDTGFLHTPGSEEKYKFKDAFWFTAPVWFLNNTAILSCFIHLKNIPTPSEKDYSSYIFNWSSQISSFFLQENNYKTLNHFYIALWKQKPLIWVTIWTVSTNHQRTYRLLHYLASCLQQLRLTRHLPRGQEKSTVHHPSPCNFSVYKDNTTPSTFWPLTKVIQTTILTPPLYCFLSLMLNSHSSKSFRQPKLGHMAILKVDQTSLVHAMWNPM